MQYLNSRIFDMTEFMIPKKMVKSLRPSIIECSSLMHRLIAVLGSSLLSVLEIRSGKVQKLEKPKACQAKARARRMISDDNNGYFPALDWCTDSADSAESALVSFRSLDFFTTPIECCTLEERVQVWYFIIHRVESCDESPCRSASIICQALLSETS